MISTSPKPRKPLQRKTPLRSRSLIKPSLRASIGKTVKAWKGLKSKQRPVSPEEKALHDRMAALGCIACLIDGRFNDHVSIHHLDGRTKPDCHKEVLALCAQHHQQDDTDQLGRIAVHPNKAQFEGRYGSQYALLAYVMERLSA
jgi:hypothetical protein